MTRRDHYDPFAPPTPPFPGPRLQRARIPATAIAHLRDRYEDLSQQQALRFAVSIRQQSDGGLRHRFTLPQDLGGLQQLTVPVLRDLAAAQGLGVSGQKDELITRITEAASSTPSQPSGSQGAQDGPVDQDDQGDGQSEPQQPAETPEQPAATPDVEQPAEQPVEQPVEQPAEQPAAPDVEPQPEGTGDTITVQTDGDPLADPTPQPRDRADEVQTEAEPTTNTDGPVVDEPTDPTAQPHTAAADEQPVDVPTSPADTVQMPAAVLGTPVPNDVPAVGDQAVVETADGQQHIGTLPPDAAVDADAALASAPAPVEPVATETVARSKTATKRSQS